MNVLPYMALTWCVTGTSLGKKEESWLEALELPSMGLAAEAAVTLNVLQMLG